MGLQSQLGIAEETTYGTAVAPTRFYEFVSHGLERRHREISSDAIRAGGRRLRRGARRKVAGHDGGGPIELEVATNGYGLLFKHMLGSVATDDANAPDYWTHTFEMAALKGQSLTVQAGVEGDDGTVEPFNFAGTKLVDWRLAVQADGYLRLSLTADARDVLVSGDTGHVALAAPVFTNASVFDFSQAALLLGGVPTAFVSSADVGLQNQLKVDRNYLGQGGLKVEPRPDGYPTLDGNMTADFVSRDAFYDSFAADQPLALEMSFVGDEIVAGVNEELTVSVPEIRLNGGTPTVSGPQIPEVTIPFMGYFNDADPSITVTMTNTDDMP